MVVDDECQILAKMNSVVKWNVFLPYKEFCYFSPYYYCGYSLCSEDNLYAMNLYRSEEKSVTDFPVRMNFNRPLGNCK